MTLIYTRPKQDIIHVHSEGQFELTSTFVRLQEFYESPYPAIRGRYNFTVDDLAMAYEDDGKPFDYFSKWHGFNVPGHVVEDFFAHFEDLTPAESKLNSLVWRAIQKGVHPKHFYVIGTHQDEDITHELAHAMWYLDVTYKHRAVELLTTLRGGPCFPHLQALEAWLRGPTRGYGEAVLEDESHAYLATSPRQYLIDKLGLIGGANLFSLGAPFRKLFREFTGLDPLS